MSPRLLIAFCLLAFAFLEGRSGYSPFTRGRNSRTPTGVFDPVRQAALMEEYPLPVSLPEPRRLPHVVKKTHRSFAPSSNRTAWNGSRPDSK
ncbi:MAG: hypothetical protein JWO30_160 [Fibrobacteres bacterium]|nr:hypothetical protein [Fibrobacterota bacterium]